jgi:hypothetical protein
MVWYTSWNWGMARGVGWLRGESNWNRDRTHTHTHTHTYTHTHRASQSALRTSVCLHFRNISVSAPIQHLGYSNRSPVTIMMITVLSDVMRRRFGRQVPILRSNIKHQFSRYLRFTNSCGTNKCTVSLLCISLLFSSYMFRLNCRHQGADTILLNSQQ